MLRCTIIVGILLINVVIGSSKYEEGGSQEEWHGKWFPKKPGDPDPLIQEQPEHVTPRLDSENVVQGEWHGKWFPKKPQENDAMTHSREGIAVDDKHDKKSTMGILDPACDDTKTNLWLDYDPYNLTHQSVYVCTEDRSLYKPKRENRPTLLEYVIPREYSALHRCMNETITYADNIPTFGTHRSNWPVYGEYDYVPVQRWLHSLEHGAIVFLYHPCANRQQKNKFRKLIKSCLYRHVITAFDKLTQDRPFALVAWGKSLEMSYIDINDVLVFIRMNALQAPEKTSRDGQYNAGLIEKANIVSDENDSNLCPNM